MYSIVIAGGAQDSSARKPEVAEKKSGGFLKSKKSKSVSSLKFLEAAVKNNDSLAIARQYEEMGGELASQKDFEGSNDFYQKALNIYKERKDNEKQSELYRKIAFNNEALNKDDVAVVDYASAKRLTNKDYVNTLNANDISRIQNRQNANVQKELIDENIKILEKEEAPAAALSQAYSQKAEIDFIRKDTIGAISSLKKAAETVATPEEKISIQQNIADIYANNDDLGTAINMTAGNAIKSLDIGDNISYFIYQQQLAELQFKNGKNEAALSILDTTLQRAYKDNNTEAIAQITQKLFTYWNEKGNAKEANKYAQLFLERILNVIDKDSLIVQNKLYSEISERVALLEKEKETQRLLFQKTKKYNLGLSLLLLLTVLTIIGIIWFLYKLKRKNLQIQLQSLRREMNPHFIFNSLNSVNQFIAENNEMAANKYLSNYAKLMRNVMTASNKDFITLNDEKDGLAHYLSLEALRFQDKFDYRISVDEQIDIYQTLVPNMLLQPFVENAIWHGLRYKNEKGVLDIHFYLNNGKIKAVIKDDGIGMAASRQLKTKNQQTYQSRGIHNIEERINTLNKLYRSEISYEIAAANKADSSGTVVIISWLNPKHYDISKN
ncbi:tetratricopeptide repeat-containing sensor histidine kinase [Polluticaenibacter yanchengensis]|uniref:Histidine kinase n=1 Tax=Polluticaenibacter yanchengensis TaxID=3014562 RepID=A0ABT4UGT1_9BACT|nr:histidine kinase [Chitinophagaceae bacterium LY-5]